MKKGSHSNKDPDKSAIEVLNPQNLLPVDRSRLIKDCLNLGRIHLDFTFRGDITQEGL